MSKKEVITIIPDKQIIIDKSDLDFLYRQIADLEAKLAEMQNEKDELISKYRYWRGECAELKQQLAEKEKKIDKLEDKLHHYYEETLNKGTCGLCEHLRGEYKTDFAIEQLEKVKETLYPELRFDYSLYLRVMHTIDSQIKELKEGK